MIAHSCHKCTVEIIDPWLFAEDIHKRTEKCIL